MYSYKFLLILFSSRFAIEFFKSGVELRVEVKLGLTGCSCSRGLRSDEVAAGTATGGTEAAAARVAGLEEQTILGVVAATAEASC